MSAPYIDREVINAKLRFLSTAVGFMDNHRDDFPDDAGYALSMMLSEIAKEIFPEGYKEPPSTTEEERNI